jgi:hypothetical protein
VYPLGPTSSVLHMSSHSYMSAVCADRLDYCCSVLLEVELEVELSLEVLYCIGYICRRDRYLGFRLEDIHVPIA